MLLCPQQAKSLDEQLNKACAPAGATTTASPSASASSPDIGSDGATGSADTHLSVSTGSPASTSEASSGTSELQGSAPSVSNADEHARPFDIMTHEVGVAACNKAVGAVLLRGCWLGIHLHR